MPAISKRGIHLDLKGLPPTPKRFVELLKFLVAERYNVVLVEWEDSLPWKFDDRFRNPTDYSRDDLVRFVKTASEIGGWHILPDAGYLAQRRKLQMRGTVL